jgi:chromosome partitioning protein
MKGGVGKTTIAAHVMRVLYLQLSKKVLLVDLDRQFNLTQCLMTRSAYDKLKVAHKTIFTAMEPPSNVGLFEVATTIQPPPKPVELATQLKRAHNGQAYLHLIAG